jgi:small-conductance mechanosensitive channel
MAYQGQTKKHSLLESFINIVVGIGISFTAQLVVFPWFGIYASLADNIMITLIFTGISLIRSYILRRIFNNWMLKYAR